MAEPILDDLLTEQIHPASVKIDALPTLEILKVLNAADAEVPAAVAGEIPAVAAAVEAIVRALEAGGNLVYIGAGTSGRLGILDAAECPPTFHVPPDLVRAIIAGGEKAMTRSMEAAEDSFEDGARDLVGSGFTRADVLVGISASGRTPYVLGAVEKARKMGAVTCGISCTPASLLSQAVDFPIEPKPGPEVLAGSTRMRAGTATKLVLNMISTAVMIRLGHVYGNLMVNVQPANAKLTARAQRIIRQATGVTEERAAELLDASGQSVRVAIVMQNRNIPREEAERLLAQSHGRIRRALE
jgi:N-acetylmuramic acid 6-phosphate etherase